jgi:hypothetical protein
MTVRRVWPWSVLGFVLAVVLGLLIFAGDWDVALAAVIMGTATGLTVFAYFYAITHAWRRYRDGWLVALSCFPGLATALYIFGHPSEPMLARRGEQTMDDGDAEGGPATRSWLAVGVVIVAAFILLVASTIPVSFSVVQTGP